MLRDGSYDVWRATEALAARLPQPIAGLARLAYNLRWTWTGGEEIFAAISPHLWGLSRGSAVRFLGEASLPALRRAAESPELVERVDAAVDELNRHLGSGPAPGTRPIAFLCAEFGIHQSLPIYSGGLGVLAGDMLKEASDRGIPLVGVGLLYRQGYFRQRFDLSGWQHEWWSDVVPERLAMALVRDRYGRPVVVRVPIRGHDVRAQVWRVDVGRVPLFLLDCERPDNSRVDRWITSRLYVADRHTRLAQYALLGRGGMRALAALGIEPAAVHLNEGHAAFAPLELAAMLAEQGKAAEKALEEARRRTVFTTHTPVAAGNETIDPVAVAELVADLPGRLSMEMQRIVGLGRVHPDDAGERFGLTPLGLRMSRAVNGVSRRHGIVARGMWRDAYPGVGVDDVPIGHVTNGIHLPTWVAAPVAALFDRVLGEHWRERATDPATWEGLAAASDAELWEVRRQLRAELVDYVRDRSIQDRLARGEAIDYIESAARSFDPEALTIGFARRLATYKRLDLLIRDPERAVRLLRGDRPVQLVLAGKAHPQDDGGKQVVQALFRLRREHGISGHVVFLEDYDLSVARRLVAGCDVWVNLPRYPLEACGTSGMKAAVNGVVNLSVRDGWWEEACEPGNGWGINGAGHTVPDGEDVDAADSMELHRILAEEVLPIYFARDAAGIPRAWVERVRASITTVAPRFCATRMVEDYARLVWGSAAGRTAAADDDVAAEPLAGSG